MATAQTTASTTYTDLTTAGPAVTVTIPASGKALVTLTSLIDNTNADKDNFMAFAVSGNTTLAASDATALRWSGKNGDGMQFSATYLVTGLTAGSNTFTAKYRTSANTATFTNRSIIVIPLP